MNAAAQSFFVGRTSELQFVADALSSSTSAGIILVGPAGIGKTAILQKALFQSQPQAHVLRLRGSAAMADSPYSALNGLLSELEDGEVTHPVIMLRALTALLRKRAQGRDVVLAVDNVELLDSASAMIITQLVATRVVKVLLTARQFHLADASFMSMWRQGSLLRLDVAAFPLKESALFCEAELGKYVSADLVRTVHQLSGGTPKLLRGCLREVQRQGLLVEGTTSWALRAGVALPCPEATAGVMSQVAALGPAARQAALLVAMSGGLPLSVLVHLTQPSSVDALQDAGLATVGHDRRTTVRCSSTVIRDGIRMEAGQGEALEAYELVLTAEEWNPSDLHAHHHAAWRQAAGLPLHADLVADAARRLNDHGKYAEALALLAEPGASSDTAVLVEMLRSHLALGDYSGFEATSELLLLSDAETEGAPAVRVLLMRAEFARRSGLGARQDLIDQAHALAGRTTDEGMAPLLLDEVLIARAEALAFDGRYQEVAALLSGRKQEETAPTNDSLVRMDSLLGEAWSMGVQQLDAMELARSVAGFVLENHVTERTRAGAYAQIWETHRTAGDVDGALHIRELTTQQSEDVCFAPRSYEEVSRALARAYQGHVEDALRILLPTFDQLRLGDPWGVLPAAAAGIAYCYGRRHDLEPLIEYLPYSEPGAGTPWKIAQTARYFQLLASSHTENRRTAAQEFRTLALRSSEGQGRQYMTMLGLFRAVRLGNHEALDALGAVAAQLQGPFARLGELYAKGLGSQDCEFLLRSMEMAHGMGDAKLAYEAAQHALQGALGQQDKQTLRHVQRRVREVMPDTEEWGNVGARLAGLTRREREVAIAAAAGATNRDIAGDMCVSVRTVEGHLYQVYSKLNVCSRAELAGLIPTAQVQA
jgi:DNA-binding CsgD family transcriptional regulator